MVEETSTSGSIQRTMLSNAKFEVEKLNGTNNFGMWQCEVQDLLFRERSHIALEAKPKDMSEEDWSLVNRQACGTIRLCLAKEQKYFVMKETSAAQLWKKLEDKYMTKSIENRLYLKKKLFRFQYKKDHEKHDPPSLSDGVQRLKNIGKRSNYRLRNESVHTVEDFLILLLKDSEQLKRVLNLKPKMLDETINQARRCIINERIFSYIDLQEKEGVVFNIVGEVKGLILGVQYLPMHLLSESDKANAQRLLVSACEHWDHVKQYDNETSLMQYLSQIVPTENPSNSPSGEVPSTSDSVENFRTSNEHCSTSFQHNVSAVIPASINNLEFSNSPIYSPSFHDLWIDPCFGNLRIDPCFGNLLFGLHAHQPHDESASKVNVHNRWKTLLKIFKRRRAAALMDSQPPKKQRVF